MRSDRIAVLAATLPLFVFGAGGDYEVPDPVHFWSLIAAIAGFAGAACNQRWAGTLVLGALLALASYFRIHVGDDRSSDVMLTTNEAVGVLFGGGNPYAHAYQMTNPPGGPFGYPPGEIVFYGVAHLVGGNLFRVDVACSILSMFMIASLALIVDVGLVAVGVGVLAYAPDVIFHLTDGSNDNAAAFLVLASVVFLAWSYAVRGRTSAVLWWAAAGALGWSIAFKEYAVPIALFLALFVWRSDPRRARGWIAAVLGSAALFVLPFLVWNPVAFVANVGGALFLHTNVWGRNVWHDVAGYAPFAGVLFATIAPVMVVVVVVLVVLLWRKPASSLGAALLQGLAIVAAIFLFARWTTSVYYMFLLPLVMAGAALACSEERLPTQR